jgi:hypothetical protein
MTSFICAFVLFIVIIGLMAIGVMMKRNTIQGSCGGLPNVEVERMCNCDTTCDIHSNEKRLYQITEPTKI